MFFTWLIINHSLIILSRIYGFLILEGRRFASSLGRNIPCTSARLQENWLCKKTKNNCKWCKMKSRKDVIRIMIKSFLYWLLLFPFFKFKCFLFQFWRSFVALHLLIIRSFSLSFSPSLSIFLILSIYPSLNSIIYRSVPLLISFSPMPSHSVTICISMIMHFTPYLSSTRYLEKKASAYPSPSL